MRNGVRVVSAYLGVTLIAGAAGALAAPAATAQDPAVARVNGRAILERDFNLAVQMQFRARGPGERRIEDLRAVRESVLESLIDHEILYQKAAAASIEVPRGDVDRELERMKDGFGTDERFEEFLRQSGVAESTFREQVRRTLIVTRFAETVVAPDIKVTDEEVRRHYEEHAAEMVRPAAVRISQVVVRAAPGAPRSERTAAREKIEAILRELRAGKDFAEMARRHSDGPEAERGGDSGWVSRDGGALPNVEDAALRLRPGELSDIVETRRGFHIIKATEARAQTPIPLSEAAEPIRAMLAAGRRDAKVRDYLARQKTSCKIERLQAAAP